MEFAKRVVPDPVIIRLKRNEESLDNIKQVQSPLHYIHMQAWEMSLSIQF